MTYGETASKLWTATRDNNLDADRVIARLKERQDERTPAGRKTDLADLDATSDALRKMIARLDSIAAEVEAEYNRTFQRHRRDVLAARLASRW